MCSKPPSALSPQPSALIKLAIIIVSWNTRELLRRAIITAQESLASSDIRYELVVVDNASQDGTPAMLQVEFSTVRLIEAGSNLGFAGGNNLALRALLEAEPPPEYLLLLNPDTETIGAAIPILVRFLDTHLDVAVVGPQLRYPDGSVQSSRRRFPDRGVFFFESTPLETYLPQNRWARRYRMDDLPADHEQDVDWLMGAALLVRSAAIRRAGLLDQGFVMYSEELEWQQRIRRSGVRGQGSEQDFPSAANRIVYLPAAKIIHHEGQSSDQAPARRYAQFHQSRLRYVRMTLGPPHALGLWVFLLLAYGTELVLEAAKWLAGHKRALRAQRVRVYGVFLRALLRGPNRT
ncbi:MAG: glycosyltransferase family 2 protein [Roseiflexaceae bacterium]|nr:glycosyltransferase family 2 protein [Roseiflexaceae bacterium]